MQLRHSNRWTTAGNGKTYTSLYNVQTGNVSDAVIQVNHVLSTTPSICTLD